MMSRTSVIISSKSHLLLLLTLNIFCISQGYPEEKNRKTSCRIKWDMCMMEGDEAKRTSSEKPTSGECDDFIRRKYDCPPPQRIERGGGSSDRDRNKGKDEEETPRRKKVDDNDSYKRSNQDDRDPPPRRKYEDEEPPPVRRRKESEERPRSRPRYRSEEADRKPRKQQRQKDDEADDRSRERPRSRDDDPYTDIDQKTKTVSDNYSSKIRKNEGKDASKNLDPDEVRRRDKFKKEKERIFVKEDLIELDDVEGDLKESKLKVQKTRPDAAEQVKSMMSKNKESSGVTSAPKMFPAPPPQVLQLTKGLF